MARLFWYFLIYSFLGFLLEVLFARITHAPKQDRKCMLLLPLCPVYGIGALLIVSLPPFIQRSGLLLLTAGALCATAAEYFMDWLYETAFRVRFWDYSALPGNLRGRVCLPFSAAWGLLSLVLVHWVHPALIRLTAQIPPGWALPAALFFLLDSLLTILLLRAARSTAALRWYDRFRRPRREHL